MEEQKISHEVEKTLEAYAHDEILQENPFLLTRIEAEWESRRRARPPLHLPRLDLRLLAVLILVLVNIVTVVVAGLRSESDIDERLVSELQSDLQIDDTLY